VWSVIGAIAQACDLPVTTAVTCPTIRTHPAIVAQAAATSAVMLDGRFTLGVGTGEALNEHAVAARWPSYDTRMEMLEEAVALMRRLWEGDFVTTRGTHYEVENARIYTLPDEPPKVFVSGFGEKATEAAARFGDGYISTSPDPDLLRTFKKLSDDKPAHVGFKVAWAPDREQGIDHAYRLWPNAGLPGELAQVLPSVRHFEQATQLVTRESTEESVVAGPDPEEHLAELRKYVEAGYDEVYVANMGPHYREMIEGWGRDVLPRFREG
jgi:G6PDH family F420-dependent oxidoreductase